MNRQNLSQREQLQQRFKTARVNLLLMLVFTVLNIILFFTGSSTMLLFSASIPYYTVILGSSYGFTSAAAVPFYIFAAGIILIYFLCWLLSKKRYGWLIPALVLFVLDIFAMGILYIGAKETSGIADLLFHAWVLYYLIIGIYSGVILKKMPPEDAQVEVEVGSENLINSTPLRRAGENDKARIFLEHTYGSYHICYRRVKRKNQLVINNYIYDEVEYLIEPPHSLHAILDGHVFEVGYANISYLNIDGIQIKKKFRWY